MLAAALLLFWSGYAHADGLDGGAGADPCAVYDAGSPVVLVPAADGGAALPVAICQGQAAPAHGVFLTVDRAAVLAGELARGREVEQALQDQPVPAPPSAMVVVAAAVGGLVLGAIATAWIVHEVK